MSQHYNPLKIITFDMMQHPIPMVSFDDAKFDLYMISGFLTEKWYLPYGAHTVKMGELAKSDWLKHLVNLAQEHHFNLYFYNWPAKFWPHNWLYEIFSVFFGEFYQATKKANYQYDENSDSSELIDRFLIKIDIDDLIDALPWKQRFVLKLLKNKDTNKRKSLKILKAWNDALEATRTSAAELDKFITSKNRKTLLLGHSLGGRLALQTLEMINTKNVADVDCIAMAPAIRPSELHIHKMTYRAEKIEIFYSKADVILALLYRLAELTFEKPIGLSGAENKIGREFNCTKHRDKLIGHTDYEANIVALLTDSEIFKQHISLPLQKIPTT